MGKIKINYKELVKGEIFILDKYGLFKNNSEDLRQIKEMTEMGFEIINETFDQRIWKKKKHGIR